MNEILNLEWYSALIDDCKSIIVEAVFTSRWALIEGYWNLGKRIREDKNWGKYSKGAYNSLSELSKKIEIGERTIYRSLQFYDKYPDLNKVPEGKHITWNKIITKYLPTSKGYRPETEHYLECPKCHWRFKL